MAIQLILLFWLIFLSPFFPPVITPFSYPLIALLLLQKASPWTLSLIAIGANTLGSIIIWRFLPVVTIRFRTYQTQRENKDITSLLGNRLISYTKKNDNISQTSQRFEQYMEKKGWGIGLFIFSAIIFWSAVPDIVIIKIIRKKINFFYYVTSAILGKSAVYIPIIFIGKSLLALLRTRFWF